MRRKLMEIVEEVNKYASSTEIQLLLDEMPKAIEQLKGILCRKLEDELYNDDDPNEPWWNK